MPDISCDSSVWQTIHMKCRALFSLKNKKKILRKCCLLTVTGALKVNEKKEKLSAFFFLSGAVYG